MSSARVPVCSPELLENGSAISNPEDLLKYPILREEKPWDVWDQWFARAGFQDAPKTTGPRLENVYLALQAAEEGQGIALGPRLFMEEKIALGRLMVLSESESDTRLYYTITFAKNWKRQPKIVAFREWLHAEAGSFSRLDGSVNWVSATAR